MCSYETSDEKGQSWLAVKAALPETEGWTKVSTKTVKTYPAGEKQKTKTTVIHCTSLIGHSSRMSCKQLD